MCSADRWLGVLTEAGVYTVALLQCRQGRAGLSVGPEVGLEWLKHYVELEDCGGGS